MTTLSKLYAGLATEQKHAAESIGETRVFARGAAIFRDGEFGDTMYLVSTGKVTISKTANPGEVRVLDVVLPGGFFGEMSVLDNEPRSAHAVAEEDSEVRILRRCDLDRLSAISPQILINLLKGVSDRLRETNRQYIAHIVHQAKLSLVGQMAGTIIHDFKSPLTVIRATAEIIEMELEDGALRKKSQVIMRNVDRITGMANDLLAFALGKLRLNLQRVDANAWTEQLSELLGPLLDSRQIQLRRDVRAREELWMDPDKMIRVIYNLSINAVEAMNNGGALTVRVSNEGDETLIELADTGPGIPEEIRDRLFDTFVTHGKRHGTGLGTAIARRIVEEHGGTISFTTATGKGTTFHIRLPIAATKVAPPIEAPLSLATR